jgi:hypothetical protein
MTKLYDVPRNSKIRILSEAKVPPSHRDFEENEVLNFKHIDGAYSYCLDKDNQPVHLAAWTEVEVVNDN